MQLALLDLRDMEVGIGFESAPHVDAGLALSQILRVTIPRAPRPAMLSCAPFLTFMALHGGASATKFRAEIGGFCKLREKAK